MKWSEQGITLIGAGNLDTASVIQKAIWNDIASPLWYSRCKAARPHHKSLVQSDYAFDYVRSECRKLATRKKAGFELVWRLSEEGPHELFEHWLVLALAYRRGMIDELVARHGFRLEQPLPDIADVLSQKRSTVFVDTDTDLLMLSTEQSNDDVLRVWFDLGRDPKFCAVDTLPAKTRKRIHKVWDSGRCACFVCHDLYLNFSA